MDTPNSANTMAARSTVPRLTAEMIPMGTPRTSQKTAAPTASIDGHREAAEISSFTGTKFQYE